MADTNDTPLMPEPCFPYLVQTFFLQALISAGKIPNPVTKETKKAPELVKFNIGMLEVLQKKTKGNISVEETKLLEDCLHQVRLAFVEIQGA